jgi:adenine-specific DNA-methyltransferase
MPLGLPGLASCAAATAFAPDARAVILQEDTEEALRRLPQRSFRLVVTSPPYNIGKSYERQVALDAYLAAQRRVAEMLVGLLSDDGSLCWQVGNFVDDGEVFPLDAFFYPMFKGLGLKLRNRIVWHFEHGLHASRRFSGRYETLLWFTRSDRYVFNLDSVRVPAKYPGKRGFKGDKKGLPTGNPLGKNPSDLWAFLSDEMAGGVWDIPNVKSNHCEKTIHPCQFPVELAERCVLAFSEEDDWVLDPYAGVGTTVVAALKRNRRGVGIDRDAAYCEVAMDRIAALQAGELKVRPLGKPIHQPTGRETVAQTPPEWSNGQLALAGTCDEDR